jgi:DNA-binding beta-propeller fold protein YncE
MVELVRRRIVVLSVLFAAPCAVLAACGSRTGLLVPEELPVEAGKDARRDGEAGPDVVPTIDATKRDATRTDCPDADSTFVYVVTSNDELLSFYPPTVTFTKVGTLKCPAKVGESPYSMGVDRKGTAYVTYTDGELFKVSTKDASCTETPFVAGQADFPTFGMGFATKGLGPAEDLYIASTAESLLGRIDVTGSFGVTKVGLFAPPLTSAELTGTGDGRLYAFYRPTDSTSAIAEIDKATAKVVASDPLPTVDQGSAWAFAFWGGYFWLFTQPDQQRVTRYDPATKSVTVVGGYSSPIVGAGVSTCAPQ